MNQEAIRALLQRLKAALSHIDGATAWLTQAEVDELLAIRKDAESLLTSYCLQSEQAISVK